MRVSLLLLLTALAPACKPACPAAGPAPAFSPRVERWLAQLPDSASVGVLLSLHEPLSAEQRRQLERCGLRIGSVLEGVVTGEAEKGDMGRLAALPFVAYIEVAEELPLPPFPLDTTPQK